MRLAGHEVVCADVDRPVGAKQEARICGFHRPNSAVRSNKQVNALNEPTTRNPREKTMSVTLRSLLKLPEVKLVNPAAQAEQFGKTFRLKMDGVNQNLRIMTAKASPAEKQPLEGQRIKLIEAFQKTTAQIDPADPAKADQSIQRLFAALDKIGEDATREADGLEAASAQWTEREGDFDDAAVRIGELEDAGHAKAPVLRNLADAIRSRADSRNFSAAVAALDQLLPKLDEIYQQHQQANGEDDAGSVGVEVGDDDQVSEDVQIDPDAGPREGLTILVKESETGEAVEGALVTVGDQSDTTSAHGLATVELPVGQHDYEVSLDGYRTSTDSVEIIEGDNPELVVDLIAGSDIEPREGLTVLVQDGETGEAVEDVRVTVGDQTDATSSHGLATVELPVGTHSYEALAAGYEGASGEVEIIAGDNPELVIELAGFSGPREGLTILVRDGESGEKLEGVEVAVGDQIDTTSAEGLATVELPVGTHEYEAIAEDYESELGDVEIIEGDNPELVIDLTYNEECELDEHEGGEDEGGDVIVGGDDEVGEDDDLTDELEDAERFIVAWDQALSDVSDQVDKLRKAMEGADDFGLAAVRDGLATVMDKFPDLDLEPLAAAARAEDVEAYEKTLGQTSKEIRQVRELLSNGPLLSTIDENPFITTTVHATINGVLDEIVDELDIKIKNPKPKLKMALSRRKGLKVAKRKAVKARRRPLKKVKR